MLASGYAALAALVLAAGAVPAEPVDGPLGVRTSGPVRELFLEMTAADARLPARRSFSAGWSLANSWSSPTTLVRGRDVVELQVDGQTDALTLSVGGPALPRLATRVEARVGVHWGGWTDGVIEGWHRLIGFTNFERQRHAQHQLRYRLRESGAGGRAAFDLEGATLAIGGVTIRNQLLLAQGGDSLVHPGERARWAVSLRGDVKLPLGSLGAAGSSGGADAGLGLLGTVELGRRWVLHGNVFGSAWSGFARDVALQPRPFHAGAEASLAFLAGGWAFLLEDRILTPLFPTGWRRAGSDERRAVQSSALYGALRPHNQISVGVRRGPVTAWFSEDMTPGRASAASAKWFFNSNAPDLVVGLDLRRSF